MSKPIVFGDFYFSTRKKAIEEARNRISQYQPGERLRLEDEEFFISLLQLHPRCEEKVIGIPDFITVQIDFNQNRCLYIEKMDGSRSNFSWVKCIRPATQKQKISSAFRRAVSQRIDAFKNGELKRNPVCPPIR